MNVRFRRSPLPVRHDFFVTQRIPTEFLFLRGGNWPEKLTKRQYHIKLLVCLLMTPEESVMTPEESVNFLGKHCIFRFQLGHLILVLSAKCRQLTLQLIDSRYPCSNARSHIFRGLSAFIFHWILNIFPHLLVLRLCCVFR